MERDELRQCVRGQVATPLSIFGGRRIPSAMGNTVTQFPQRLQCAEQIGTLCGQSIERVPGIPVRRHESQRGRGFQMSPSQVRSLRAASARSWKKSEGTAWNPTPRAASLIRDLLSSAADAALETDSTVTG